MKQIMLLPLLMLIVLLTALRTMAQPINASMSALLDKYYGIKNALVAGDGTTAAKKAAEFKTVAASLAGQPLNEAEAKTFKSVQAQLSTEAENISNSKDIAKQRESFARLSEKMIILAKGSKLTAQAVYIDYCPMKKASWLSAEQAIKNPYYGSSMLTCGKVTDTLH